MSGRKIVVGIVAATILVTVAGSAKAGIIDQLAKFGAKPGSGTTAPDAITSMVASSAITPYSGRGPVVIDTAASHTGSCTDSVLPCNATGGTCECDVFHGSVIVPQLGKSSLNLNVTTADDTIPNGVGNCFPGSGHGTICNLNSCLGIFVTGMICSTPISEIDPNNGEVAIQANENFYIVKPASTGSVAGSSGGGSLQIADDITVVNNTMTSVTGYGVLNGVFQLHP